MVWSRNRIDTSFPLLRVCKRHTVTVTGKYSWVMGRWSRVNWLTGHVGHGSCDPLSALSWYHPMQHFNGHFPGKHGIYQYQNVLSSFCILLELRMTEVVVTTGATGRAKFQSNRHHQQTDSQLLTGRSCPSCRPTNSVRALRGKSANWNSSCAQKLFWPDALPDTTNDQYVW